MKKFLSRLLSISTAVVMLATSMPVSALAGSYEGSTNGGLTQQDPAGGAQPEQAPVTETVKVSFIDPKSESAPETRTTEKGGTIAPSDWPIPAHAGFRFTGWYLEDTQMTTLEDLQQDLQLTAKYVAQFTVTFANWDDTPLSSVTIDEGSSFVASTYYDQSAANGQTPVREVGYAFTGWEPAEIDAVTADAVVTAVYQKLAVHTITINYVYANGKAAADPYVATVYEGYEMERAVASPSIEGYVCDRPSVIIDGPITADKAEQVTYSPSSETKYTVEYYQQDIEGTKYTLVGTEERQGNTGDMTAVTADDAAAHLEDGFYLITDMTSCNKGISAKGTTAIRVYYNREVHYVVYDTADGSYVEPVGGLFGAAVTMPADKPARPGYTFTGWDKTVTEIGAEDVTVTAQWKAEKVDYTVVVWRENADDSEYSVLGTLVFSGETGTVAAYTADKFTDKNDKNSIERKVENGSPYETKDYFDYSPEVTAAKYQASTGDLTGTAPLIKGDGTTIYNVYYSRRVFTAKFFVSNNVPSQTVLTLRDGTVFTGEAVTVTMVGHVPQVTTEPLTNTSTQPLLTITAKYDEDLQWKYSGDVTWPGLKDAYNGWETVNKDGYATVVTSTRSRMDSNLCNVVAGWQQYKLQTASKKIFDDVNYLVEGVDGTTYQEAGYWQLRNVSEPGQMMSGGNVNSNKQIMGFTFSGRAVYAITSPAESTADYTIYDDPATRTLKTPAGGLNYDTVASILKKGTWQVKRAGTTNYTVPAATYYVTMLWYTRNKYTVELRQNTQVETIKDVPYQQLLSAYDNDLLQAAAAGEVPARPSSIPADYTFAGWYYDEGYTALVDWTTATLPAGDLVLYGYWKKPTCDIVFDYEDDVTPDVQQTVPKQEKAQTLATPVRDGYRFDYWYYLDDNGRPQIFSFSMEITRNMAIFAHWTATNVTYTVKYVNQADGSAVFDENGAALAEKTVGGKVGDTVTLEAPVAFDAGHAPLFPVTLLQSIVLGPSSTENVITFSYSRADAVYYSVRYVDEEGIDIPSLSELAAGKTGIATTKAVVTETAPSVNGYTPESYQLMRTLALETSAESVSQNIITFVYRSNPTGSYTVQHHCQFANSYGYELVLTEELGAPLGSQVTAQPKDYLGFTVNAAASTMSGVVYTSAGAGAGLTLHVYYNRLVLPYTARFADEAAQDADLKTPVTASARYGREVTVYAADDIPGYTLKSAPSAKLTVSADAAQNVYTFLYTQNTYFLTYDANGGSGAPVDTAAYHNGDTATLAGAGSMTNSAYRFEGWSAAPQGVCTTLDAVNAIPMLTAYTFADYHDATVYAVWSNRQATLSYASDAAPTSGTMPGVATVSLNTQDRSGSAQIADSDIARVGYTFEGWQRKDASGAYTGDVYHAGDPISLTGDVTLYAVWAPVNYAIHYALTTASPASRAWTNPNTVTSYNMESESLTLESAAMAGYDFVGWFKDAAATIPAGTPAVIQGETYGDQYFYAGFAVRKPVAVTLTGFNGMYDALAHGVTLNDPNGELLSTDTIAYSTPSSFTDATGGAQTVTVTITRDGTEIARLTAEVNITKRALAVTMLSAEDLVYTGEEQETPAAKYTETDTIGTADGQTLMVTPSGDKRTNAGGNAVNGTCRITTQDGADVTHNYDVTVRPGRIAIAQAGASAVATDETYPYDGETKRFTVPQLMSGSTAITDGVTVEWRLPGEADWHTEALPTETEVRSITNGQADSYALEVRLSHANYAAVTTAATLTITPAPLTVKADDGSFPYTLNADGTAKEWSVTTAAVLSGRLYAGDTLNYALADNTQTEVGGHAVSFASCTVANADHAKNYAITTAPGRIDVTRGTAAALLTATDERFAYTAAAHEMTQPTVTVATENGDPVDRTGSYHFTYTVDGTAQTTLPSFTEAGIYTVEIAAASTTYADPVNVTITVTVTPATLTLTSGAYAGAYDGAEHTVDVLAAAQTTGLVTSAHQVTAAAMQAGQQASATHAGTYPVQIDKDTVTVTDANGQDVTKNYTIETVAGGLSITAATLTVTAQSAYAAFDGQMHTLNVTASGLQAGDSMTAYSLTPENAAAVGVHTLTPSDAVLTGTVLDGDYTIQYVEGTLTILDFAAEGVNTTYDGADHRVTVTIPESIRDLYDVTYNGSAAEPVYHDVVTDNVTVTLTPKDPSAGLPTLTHDVSVTIAAKQITLNAAEVRKTYDGAVSAIAVTLPDGAAATPADAQTILANVTFTDAATGDALTNRFTNVCDYANVEVASSCANYIITGVTSAAVIAKRAITVEIVPATAQYRYDGLDHTAAVTFNRDNGQGNGLLAGHSLTDLNGENRTVTDVTSGWVDVTVGDVTIYADAAQTEDVTDNYQIAVKDGQVRVDQATGLTLTLTPYAGVYDGAAHGVTVAAVMDGANSVALDRFDWTFGGEQTWTETNAGTTEVTVIGTSRDGNYENVQGTASIAIAKRPMTISVVSSLGNVYSGSAFSAGWTNTAETADAGLLAGQTLAPVLVNGTQTDAATYDVTFDETATDVTASGVSVKDNYDLTYVPGTLEIVAATAHAAAERTTVTYDGTAKALTLPTLRDAGGAALENVTVEWRLPGETAWQTGDLPSYTRAQSTLRAGGDASDPADYEDTAYTVEVRLSAANYTAVETTTALTIRRRSAGITLTSQTFGYDGAAHSLQADKTGEAAGDTLTYSFESGSENAWTNATETSGHPVRVDRTSLAVTNAAGENVTDCYVISVANGTIHITRQAASAVDTAKTVTYNGAAQDFDLPVLLDAQGHAVTETVTYEYRTGADRPWTATLLRPTNAEAYTLQVRMTSANYAPVVATAVLTIEQLPITVQAPSGRFMYTLNADGTEKVWTLSAGAATVDHTVNALPAGHSLAATLDAGASRSAIGDNAVNIASAAVMNGNDDVSGNYIITTRPGTLTVTASTADAAMTASALRETYRGSDYTLPQPIVAVRSEDGTAMIDRTADYHFTYTVTGTGIDGSRTYQDELPAFTAAGTYYVSIHAASSSFASPADALTTMTILPQALTLESGSGTFDYDGTVHTVAPWTIVAGALRGEDTIADGAWTFVSGLTNEQTDVADRAVTLERVTITAGEEDRTSNYTITLVSGQIVVQALRVTSALTLNGVDTVYDGVAHTALLSDRLVTPTGTYSLSGETKADGTARFLTQYTVTKEGSAEGALQAQMPEFIDASTQTVKVYVTDTTGNLILEPAQAQVTITAREVNIAVTSADPIPYDGLGHSLTGYQTERAAMNGAQALGLTGLVGSDTAEAALVAAGPYTAPGTYVVQAERGHITAGKSENYVFTYTPGTLTILQGTDLGLELTAPDVTYDGLAHGYTVQALVPAGTPYTLWQTNADGSQTQVTAETLPTQVDAGSYPLTLTIRSPYYSDMAEDTATLRIGRKPVTLTSGDNSLAPYSYDAQPQQVAAVLPGYTLAEGDSLDLTSLLFAPGMSNENTEVCDRAVLLAEAKLLRGERNVTANYDITYAPGRIVIVKSQAAQTADTAVSYVYNGTARTFDRPVMTVDGNELDGVTYEYSVDGENFTATLPEHTDVLRGADGSAQSYTLTVRMSHPGYATRTAAASLTLLPAALTVTADSAVYPYTIDETGAPVTFTVDTAQVTDGEVYEGARVVSTLTDNARAELGSQTVRLSDVRILAGAEDKTANYDLTLENGLLTIERGTAQTQILAKDQRNVYDAARHVIDAPVVTVLDESGAGVVRTGDFTLTYSVLRAGETDAATYQSLEDMDLTEAGTYRITIHAESAQYAAPADVTAELVITPRPVTVQSEDNSAAPYTYNAAEQTVRGDETVEGLVAGHTLASLTYAAGLGNGSVDVTDRAVLLESAQALDGGRDVTANYAFTFKPGRIVIEALNVTSAQLGLADVAVEYDGQAHALTLPQTIETSVGTVTLADEFTAEYLFGGVTYPQMPTFTEVGEYPVTVRLHSTSGNYAAAEATAAVRITPRPLTIAYDTVSVDYDGAAHTAQRTITGLLARDAVRMTNVNDAAVNATRLADGSFGALDVTAEDLSITDAADTSIDRSGNYDVTVTGGSLEIRPLTLTVAAGEASYVYNAAAQSMTDYTVDGQTADGETANVTLGGTTATNVVGAQKVTVDTVTVTDQSGADTTRNYVIRTQDGALTITPATLTLGVTALNVLYDGTAHQPEGYVVSGLQGSDRLDAYQLAGMPQIEAGSYADVRFDEAVTTLRSQSGADVTGNYLILCTPGSLTIEQPAMTYTVEYYYDGALGAAATLGSTRGATITAYPARAQDGYTLQRVTGLPLTLSDDAAANVIRVYYAAAAVPALTDFTDADIPLAGNMASLNVGAAVE